MGYTKEENLACWYTEEEKTEFEKEAIDTVVLLYTGATEEEINERSETSRGLEHHATQDANKLRYLIRKRVINTVLVTQEKNKGDAKATCSICSVRVARASLRASLFSRKVAAMVAAEDAAYVRRHIRTD